MKEHGIGWGSRGWHQDPKEDTFIYAIDRFLRASNYKLKQVEDEINSSNPRGIW